MAGGQLPARVRLVAFGDGAGGLRDGYLVVSLEEVAGLVNQFLERYHHVLHPADLSDHVLGLLHLLRKLYGRRFGTVEELCPLLRPP